MKLRAAQSFATGRIARAALFAAILTLTACGGDDPDPSSSAGPAPSPTTSRPPAASPARSAAHSSSSSSPAVTVVQDDPTDADAAQGVLLRLRLEPGDTFRLVRESTQESPAMGMTQKQESGNGFHFEVLDADDRNVHRVKVTYDWVLMRVTGGPMRLEYNSNEQNTRRSNPIAPLFAPLIGESFEMRLSDQGQVLGVTGMAAIADKIAGPGAGAMQDALGSLGLGTLFNDEAMAAFLQSMIPVFPDRPVAPHRGWSTAHLVIEDGSPLWYDNRYTLVQSADGQVTLGVKTAVSTPAGAQPIDMGGMKMSMDVAGSLSGWLIVDESTGLTLASSSDANLTGTMHIEGEGLPEPMTMPVKMTGTTTVANPIE